MSACAVLSSASVEVARTLLFRTVHGLSAACQDRAEGELRAAFQRAAADMETQRQHYEGLLSRARESQVRRPPVAAFNVTDDAVFCIQRADDLHWGEGGCSPDCGSRGAVDVLPPKAAPKPLRPKRLCHLLCSETTHLRPDPEPHGAKTVSAKCENVSLATATAAALQRSRTRAILF